MLPEPRSEASAVCYQDVMYLFGGNGGHFLDEFFSFSFSDSTWTQITDASGQNPPPCRGHSAVVLGDKMMIYGGMNTNQTNDLYSFDFEANSWSIVAHPEEGAGHVPRLSSFHAAAASEDAMYIFGGWNGTRRFAELLKFDSCSSEWSRVPVGDAEPAPRTEHSMVFHNDTIIIFGGFDGVLPSLVKSEFLSLLSASLCVSSRFRFGSLQRHMCSRSEPHTVSSW